MPRTEAVRLRRLNTAREVVDVLGGITAVCKMTKSKTKAAYNWTGAHGKFPARAHHIMKQALKRRSCTAPARLWNQITEKDAA